MISIRQSTPEDWKTLQTLNDEVFADNHKYDADLKLDWAMSAAGEKYFKELVNDPTQICFIAEDDGKPVGYIACSPKEIDYRHHKYLEIDNMGVSPTNRSSGLGTQLVSKVKEWAKAHGYTRLFVNSYWGNDAARNFYKKNGGKEIDVSFDIDL